MTESDTNTSCRIRLGYFACVLWGWATWDLFTVTSPLVPHSPQREGWGRWACPLSLSVSLSTSFQWIALLRVCVFSLHLLWLDRKLRKPVYYSSIAGLHLLPLANGFTCITTIKTHFLYFLIFFFIVFSTAALPSASSIIYKVLNSLLTQLCLM